MVLWRTAEFPDEFIGDLVVRRDALLLDLLADLHGEVPQTFALFLPSSFPFSVVGEGVNEVKNNKCMMGLKQKYRKVLWDTLQCHA